MNKKYWFKQKKWGFGFTPSTPEGWVAVGILVAILTLSSFVEELVADPRQPRTRVLLVVFDLMVLGIFTALFKNKVEGGLKWRWGKDSI